jgi:hypothetical protein
MRENRQSSLTHQNNKAAIFVGEALMLKSHLQSPPSPPMPKADVAPSATSAHKDLNIRLLTSSDTPAPPTGDEWLCMSHQSYNARNIRDRRENDRHNSFAQLDAVQRPFAAFALKGHCIPMIARKPACCNCGDHEGGEDFGLPPRFATAIVPLHAACRVRRPHDVIFS